MKWNLGLLLFSALAVTVTNRSGHNILVDSDDFRIYASMDEQSWRPLRMYRSSEVYRRAREEAMSRPVIVAMNPNVPAYTSETIYDPQYVIVSPDPRVQLANFN